MNFRSCAVACIAIFYLLILIAAPRPSIVAAEPPAQATEEPTKRPYVFPTPVYIPPYSDDTPAPRGTPVVTLVPGANTYTVQSGDSPWTIAQKVYGDGTKYKLIMEANGLTDQSRLRVGTVLQIPSIGGNPPPPAPTAQPVEPVIAPTLAPPTAITTPQAFPTFSPTLTTTLTATSNTESNVVGEILPTVISIVSGVLFIAAIGAGVMALLMFLRERRVEQLALNKQRYRLKQ